MNLPTTVRRPRKAHHHPIKLMGCGFVFTAVAECPQRAWDAIRAAVAEVQRIESVISSWQPTSATSAINRMAGREAVGAPWELIQLINRSLRLSELTQGAFDISGTLARHHYRFDQEEHRPLSPQNLTHLKERMDYRLIEVDESSGTVFLQKEGMQIGFGGIGKGYAAERACQVMRDLGVDSGMVNASGDLKCWGNPPGAEGWEVYIPNPVDRSQPLMFLTIPEGSIVSSGNHENFTMVKGRRLSHIVDPRTALPVIGLQTVSVICPNAEFADGLATGISVLGVKQGLDLVNRLNGVECVLIDEQNHHFFSDNL